MKAFAYGANGAAITDIAEPSPKGTQVLVKVHACGMNRADLGMIAGHVRRLGTELENHGGDLHAGAA